MIHVIHRVKRYLRACGCKLIQPTGAKKERRHVFAPVQCLATAVDHAPLDEIDHPIGKQLRMQTEIVLIRQTAQHSVRNGTNAQLQRRAVLHQLRAELPDGLFHSANSRRWRLG